MATNSANLEVPFIPAAAASRPAWFSSSVLTYVLPLALAVGLVLLRYNNVAPSVLKEGNLTVLALIAYLGATVVFVTYLLGREKLLMRIGVWTMAFGFVMNFAGWGVRWIEITEHFKQQPAVINAWNAYSWMDKVSHTFPLTGLYDVGIAFTSIAVLSSLVIAGRKNFEFIGFVTMPISALMLTLCFFLGNEITTLQPILRSYWRPIHVSLAAISYGVCLVSFGVALLYLLKDKVRIESVGLWVALLGIATYFVLGDFKTLTHGTYGLGVRVMGTGLNLTGGGVLRAELPGVGAMMRVGTLLYVLSGLCLLAYFFDQAKESMRAWGNRLMTAALVGQLVVFGAVWFQMKAVNRSVFEHINPQQFTAFGPWLLKNIYKEDPAQFAPDRVAAIAQNFLQEQATALSVSFASNPVELAGILTLIACTAFVVLFIFRGNTILAGLPSLDSLDDLTYKTVSVCFPMLAMMLITGAVWANESWGTYWSWDPKETWALITWLAYAGYLHTRIVHGWKGRSSAYFAVVGFLFVIFTYLGVSFVLPGLHSYAGVD